MRHQRSTAVFAAAAIAVAIAACSNPGSGSSSPQASVTTSGAANTAVNPTASLKGVTLTMWTATTSVQEPKTVIADFEKATGAKVTTVVIPDPYETNVPTKLATGAKPDLLFWQPTNAELNLIRGPQILQNLGGQPWVSKLSPNVASLGVIGGNRYSAVVTAPSTIGVYYNKQDFAKAGITSLPTSFPALLADAQKLKAMGIPAFYEAGKDAWPLQWIPVVLMANLTKAGSFWPALNVNKATWTNPAILSTITQYKSIIDDGLTNPDYKTGTFVNQATEVLSGKTAMAVQLNALASQMETTASVAQMNANVGFFPISPTGNIGTYVPDQTNAISAPITGNATQEAAARQFIDFWLTTDYKSFITAGKDVSVEPGVTSPSTVPSVAVQSFDALNGAVGAYQVEAAIAPDLYLRLGDMLYGTKTPQQVAQACESQFTQEATAQGLTGF
jgi:raffinose/stachyose/melibiose transport system substrate-binding protein